MKTKYDIITPLDLCVDFIIECGNVIPEFNQTEQLIQKYDLELGGSCCIFASQASKLGLKVAGVGTVGEDHFGKLVLQELKGRDVDISFIKKDRKIKTGVGVILNRCADRAILTYSGSIDGVDPEQLTDDLIQKTRHIHIGSYFLLSKLHPFLGEFLLKCKSQKVTISLDTNWDPLNQWDRGLSEILPLVDIFFPNENEAIRISGKRNIEEAVVWLKKRIGIVVVKSGEKGAACYQGDYQLQLPGLDVEVRDTIGAGDSFDAGFVYGYLQDYSLEKCLRTAIVCGSLSTRETGGTKGQGSLREIMDHLPS